MLRIGFVCFRVLEIGKVRDSFDRALRSGRNKGASQGETPSAGKATIARE
jgi:hypothetical protein